MESQRGGLSMYTLTTWEQFCGGWVWSNSNRVVLRLTQRRYRGLSAILEELAECIENLEGMEIILTGDFNARSTLWGEKKMTVRGELLEQWINRFDLRLMNEENSYVYKTTRGIDCGSYLGYSGPNWKS